MSNIVKREESKELNELRALAKIAYESKQYANQSEIALLNLMLSAKDLGIPPLKAINGGFYIVNGKPGMSTGLMSDMIRRAGHSIKIVEMSKDKCIIIGQRKDNGDSFKFEYTMEDAVQAGLTNSPTWKKFPKHMLYNRCMSTVARVLFSDVIGNSYSEDEKSDIQMTVDDGYKEEPIVTIEEQSTIDDDKKERIHLLIEQCQDPNIKEDLLKFFKISNIDEMNEDQYQKCVKALEKKIAKLQESA